MELDKDFKEFVQLLNENKVEYLVVGGYSVAHHGYPRFTGDFDVWINPEITNGQKMIQVLNQFGFGSMGLTVDDFTKPDNIIQFGVEPVRIDVMTAVDGLPHFHQAYDKKEVTASSELEINFISYEDLITNKKTTNRLQDQLDVEKLSKVNRQK